MNKFKKPIIKQHGFDTQVKIKFKDVAGLGDAKIQVQQFVQFLKDPKKYHKLGARIPKGALLTGPPGTGKTMLAKACAGQAKVPFFFMSGSDFVQTYVGLGASRVRQLFSQAKKSQPSIIFIDQIDAIGKKRDQNRGNSQRQNTLNQLLVQMDGFGTKDSVVVLAATNRKEMLDDALIRPGRFDRSIDITLPDLQGRSQIFKVHLQPIKLSKQITLQQYLKRLSTLTPGYSGADIANLCNQAAIGAVRLKQRNVTLKQFQLANDRLLAGVQRKHIVNKEDKKVTAFHQSGHAVASWFLQGASPLLKLTIVPRSKGSLGFAQYLPNQTSMQTKQQLLDRICFILGGRCSQQIFFKQITTGAHDDLKKARDIAFALVTKLGMSQTIGYLGFKQAGYTKTISQYTNQKIDTQINKIILQCTQKTRNLLMSKKQLIQNLANCLLQKQNLNSKEIIKVLGQRPFPPKLSFKAYLQAQK